MSSGIDSLAFLRALHGTWRGEGEGRFPTISTFAYSETLSFEWCPDREVLRYEQDTRLASGSPSHWEVGFFLPGRGPSSGETAPPGDAWVHVSNTQDGGRVEVLEGRLWPGDDGSSRVLRLESVHHGHDPRLVTPARELQLHPDRLTWTVSMATTTTSEPQLLPHL
jgi:hypothetical protein